MLYIAYIVFTIGALGLLGSGLYSLIQKSLRPAMRPIAGGSGEEGETTSPPQENSQGRSFPWNAAATVLAATVLALAFGLGAWYIGSKLDTIGENTEESAKADGASAWYSYIQAYELGRIADAEERSASALENISVDTDNLAFLSNLEWLEKLYDCLCGKGPCDEYVGVPTEPTPTQPGPTPIPPGPTPVPPEPTPPNCKFCGDPEKVARQYETADVSGSYPIVPVIPGGSPKPELPPAGAPQGSVNAAGQPVPVSGTNPAAKR